MFARKVSVRLLPNSLQRFSTLMEGEILPWLRQQEGFLDLITLAAPDGSEVATISFWDHEGNAQLYSLSGYPQVLQVLEELLDGIPYVKTFEVVSSTCHTGALARQLGTESLDADNVVEENGPPPSGYQSYETSL